MKLLVPVALNAVMNPWHLPEQTDTVCSTKIVTVPHHRPFGCDMKQHRLLFNLGDSNWKSHNDDSIGVGGCLTSR
jgi:hypothetical protein